MKNFLHDSCYLSGDIHGNPAPMFNVLERYGIQKDCDIVILGDVGLGFSQSNDLLNYMNNWAKPNNSDIWLLRGNHDNPDMFVEEVFSGLSNVHLLKDGEIVKDKDGKKYLVVGGAISLDRRYRKQGISYWKNEHIKAQIYNKLDVKNIEGVFAHTGPKNRVLFNNSTIADGSIKNDLDNEQVIIDNIIDKFKPKIWYNGHYHINLSFEHVTKPINKNKVKVVYVNVCNVVPLYPLYS